jgi:hypothetical protein
MNPGTHTHDMLGKLPAVTLGFRIVKIAATTLGETAADWVSMSLKLGYLIDADFADRSPGLAIRASRRRTIPIDRLEQRRQP